MVEKTEEQTTAAAPKSSIEVAREKIARLIEIYSPTHQSVRDAAIAAFRGAIQEFEHAVREHVHTENNLQPPKAPDPLPHVDVPVAPQPIAPPPPPVFGVPGDVHVTAPEADAGIRKPADDLPPIEVDGKRPDIDTSTIEDGSHAGDMVVESHDPTEPAALPQAREVGEAPEVPKG